MNTDERIKQHLETSTSRLRAPDRLDEVMAEGNRRRVRTGMATVLGAAALLAAVVTVGSALITGEESPSATSPTATSPTATSLPATTLAPDTTSTTATDEPEVAPETPLGAVVAGPEGITVLDTAGDTVAEVTGDPAYGEIAMAYPDQLGGLIYQHVVTPLPWEEGSLLRLPAGAERPEVLLAPDGARIVPVGPGRSSSEHPLFYFLEDRQGVEGGVVNLRVIDLTSGQTSTVTEIGSMDVTVGGTLVAMVDRSGDCPTLTLFDAESGEVPSPLECLPAAAGVSVGQDGQTLAILAGGNLQVVSVESGEVVVERQIPEAYMVASGPGGWAVRTPSETLLLSQGGEQWSLPAVEAGWVVPYARPLEVASGATLSSGPSAELPCRPVEVELPEHDLPEAVAERRRTLFDLAAACDYEGLAAIAQADATTLTFGGGDDPLTLWVAEGRQGAEPLALLAHLLTTAPAHDDESGIWAWPAAHVNPDDESSWVELESIYDAETLELLRQAEGYLGYRVGIADDGTWMFFVGGD